MHNKPPKTFKDHPWKISYRTSSLTGAGQPVNILHDFYIPALTSSVRYDRVAGYFRSTSLAAASQGFSAFTKQNGKARFIVGADLDPDDVQAILSADKSKTDPAALTAILNAELENNESRPKNVQQGVHLLAWMVVKEFLEIRVAFRVHAKTGAPLSRDSVDDGYVHMKWGLFEDGAKNRLYFTGSLNESRTALVANAENIDVHCDWLGETESLRADEANEEFESLWEDKNPSMRVLTLPEAVKKRLIKIAQRSKCLIEIDGTSAAPAPIEPPSALELLKFALLRDGPNLPGGRYVGLETAPISPWPHQEIVARRVIDTWPCSYLLCDEVGLGKTIEAGLIIRSLYLAGLTKRVLIAAPASLTQQWHREMAGKFFLPFALAKGGSQTRHEYLLPLEAEEKSDSLYSASLTIISTGLLCRKEREGDLQQTGGFDLTLLDEAHYARRKNPGRGTRVEPKFGEVYRVISEKLRPKSRSTLLLTATPMQLEDVEVFDLIRLTDRIGPFQYDPGLSQWYYDILNRLVRDENINEHEWKFLCGSIRFVMQNDPFYYAYLKDAIIDGRVRRPLLKLIEEGIIPHDRDIKDLRRFIFSIAPLSRVMLRHTRPLLEIYKKKGELTSNLPRRIILPLPRITLTPQEKECYECLEIYCRELAGQIAKSEDKRQKFAIGFYLSFLRLRFASSLFAIRETLRRRREKINYTLNKITDDESFTQNEFEMEYLFDDVDDDADMIQSVLKDRQKEDLEWEARHLQRMLTILSDLSGSSSKMSVLLSVLQERRITGTGRIRQVVIFTRFYDTLTNIVGRLRRIDRQMLIGTYSGKGGQYVDSKDWRLSGVNREEIKHKFLRGEIDILICTDAAAEGLNLQTADLLINFDLPWNPMKVEQRIGRIDRIGQKHKEVFVLNLCYFDSAEEIVYGRLLSRLQHAEKVVGSQQLSLLPVMREEFQELADNKLQERELEGRVKERIELAKKRSLCREISPDDLYNIYARFSQRKGKHKAPVNLELIWQLISESKYLAKLGCKVMQDAGKKTIILKNLAGLPDNTALTASRQTYEYGIEDLEGRLHFAAYGDPAFDTLLSHINEFGLPACIRKLEVMRLKSSGSLVGYAVAARNGKENTCIRLITSFKELSDLELDEERKISDEENEPLKKKLKDILEKEFEHVEIVKEIESNNKRAGSSQLALDYILIKSLLTFRSDKTHAHFWPEVIQIEQGYKDRQIISFPNIPIEQAEKLYGLPFSLQIPRVGEKATINAPIKLILIALDAACRIADKIHRKKSELLTADVLARIEKEIKRILI